MPIVLQHRQEERAIRERQLRSGAARLTHIRPCREHASEVGRPVRLRNGYRKNSYFGRPCVVISSRLISDISELSGEERKYLAPEFASIERMRGRDWARAPKIEVLVIQTAYLAELTQVRDTLDSRCDDIKSGRVQPIDGETAFAQLRQKSQDRRRS